VPTGTLDLTSGSSTITASESVTVRGTFANGIANIIQVSTLNNSQIISTVHSNIISLNNYSITPDVTSAYRLIVTNSANYSIYSSTITITVLPAPTGTLTLISGSSTITASDSVTVRGTFANGTADIIRVSTSNNSQIISTVHSNIISLNNYSITPVVTSAYRVRVTNSAGFIIYSNTITITITITVVTSLVASQTNISNGQTSILTANVGNGTGILRILNGTTIQSNITSNYSINVYPSSTTTYELYVTYNSINTSYTVTIYVQFDT
jgi:hypothetical protein